MKCKSLLLCLLIVLCISCEATYTPHYDAVAAAAKANVKLPDYEGFVNDFDDVLSNSQEADLLKLLKEYEVEMSNQIAIVTLTSIQGYDGLESYSLDLANYWCLGEKDRDNGILIALYKKDRRVWIQNGIGVMDKLSDDETLSIIQKNIVPYFKKADFYTGFYRGIQEIIKELNEEL